MKFKSILDIGLEEFGFLKFHYLTEFFGISYVKIRKEIGALGCTILF